MLLRAEDAVAGVAETWDDVVVLIEMVVHCGRVDRHEGMGGLKAVDAFGAGDHADHHDLAEALFVEQVNGGDRRTGRGEHRVDDECRGVCRRFGKLGVILDRLRGLGVAVHAEEADAGRGDEVEHGVEHSDARAQNRDDDDFVLELLALGDGQR